MDSFRRIEQRYGLKLPPLYKHLYRSGQRDKEWDKLFIDLELLTPDQIADFVWEDYRKPIDGLVPFALNGRGDFYCWYLPEPGHDDEPAVMLCAHDCYVGDWFAPCIAGTIFLQTLESALFVYDGSDQRDEHKALIDQALTVLDGFAPDAWCAVLRSVKDFTPHTDEQGEMRLMPEQQLDAIVRDTFGQKFLNRDFIWDIDGLED